MCNIMYFTSLLVMILSARRKYVFCNFDIYCSNVSKLGRLKLCLTIYVGQIEFYIANYDSHVEDSFPQNYLIFL